MRRLVVLVLVALVAASCSGSDPETAAPTTVLDTTTTLEPSTTTSSTSRPTTTTTGVPRTTTTVTAALGPGDASIGGTVSGPAGPIDGATVRIERLVGRSVATADVTTSGGGAWQLASVLGGSYRVRAFKTPEFASSATEAFFLAATERRTVDFKLAPAGGERILVAVSPSPPRIDQSATLTITVGVGRVDDQGRPAITPRPGIVLTFAPGAGVLLESPAMVVTDGNGAAAWRIRCAAEGADSFQLTVGAGITAGKFTACAAGGSTPTTRSG